MKRLLRRRSLVVNGALGALLVVGIGVGYLSLTGGDDSAGASATRTVRVTRGTVVSSVSASGSVDSAKSRSLDFATSGTVTQIKVQAGDKVTKGRLLAQLDQTSAEENLQSAKASLTAAEAADTSTASGYSSYVSAKNAYKQAERSLEGTKLTAPFSGTVVSVNGTVGGSSSGTASSSSSSSSTGSQGSSGGGGSSSGGSSGSSGSSAGSSASSSGSSTTGFIELADPSKLKVTGEFTESDAIKLKIGQSATVTFDALSGVTATGKVSAIDMSPTTNNNVVQYGATITLADKPASVRLGQTTTVQVTTSTAQNVLYVPTAAVRTAGGQSTVTVQQGGKQVPKRVEVGVQGDQGTEIKSGLNEGEEVVIVTATGTGTGGAGGTQGRPGGGVGGGLGGGGFGGGARGGGG